MLTPEWLGLAIHVPDRGSAVGVVGFGDELALRIS
jgi:hypothetical protein